MHVHWWVENFCSSLLYRLRNSLMEKILPGPPFARHCCIIQMCHPEQAFLPVKDLNINEKDPSQAKTPVQDDTFELCNNAFLQRRELLCHSLFFCNGENFFEKERVN